MAWSGAQSSLSVVGGSVREAGLADERGWLGAMELSAEVRAVLACARAVLHDAGVPALLAALTACRSVERLCRSVAGHGMIGHLHRVLTSQDLGATDPLLIQRLAELQAQLTARSLRQTGRLLQILETLEASSVEAMPVKGPAWAELLYGDISLRSWSDLDVLVRHEHVAPARKALLQEGFIDSHPANEKIYQHKRGGLGQIALNAPGGNLHLELHWELTVGMSPRSLIAESVFARAATIRLLGIPVLCPGNTDLLLITCLDGTRDRWDKVEKLLGLGVQIRETGSMDWTTLMSAAREAGCVRRVAVAVAHTCRVLGLSVPSHVEGALGQDFIARKLVRSLHPSELEEGSGRGSGDELTRLLWGFATEDRVTLGLRHAAMRAFRPGPADWASIALPDWAAWLHYLIRPGRLCAKWLARLLGVR